MVIHAQRNQSQDGSNTAGHGRGGMMVVGVPRRTITEGEEGRKWGTSSGSPELAQEGVHRERRSVL